MKNAVSVWVPLVVAAIGLVTTVLGGLLGTWLAGRRDDARWEREKERESERWSRDDERVWLADRQRVFAEFIALMNRWQVWIRHLEATPPGDPMSLPAWVNKPPDANTITDDSERMLAEMALCGAGQEVLQKARALWLTIGAASFALIEADRPQQNRKAFKDAGVELYKECLALMSADLAPAHRNEHTNTRD